MQIRPRAAGGRRPRLVARTHCSGEVALQLAPRRLRATGSAPLAIAPSRCNRCGACLMLGCPAISDVGGEAMVIEPAACVGCGLCAPLCRSRAIAGTAAAQFASTSAGATNVNPSASIP